MEGKQGKTQHEYLWLENVFLKTDKIMMRPGKCKCEQK